MLTKQQIAKLRAAIRRLVQAEIDDAFKGAGDPNDYTAIEQELQAAKRNLNSVIRGFNTVL